MFISPLLTFCQLVFYFSICDPLFESTTAGPYKFTEPSLVISVIYLNWTPLLFAFILSFFIASTPIITEGPVELLQSTNNILIYNIAIIAFQYCHYRAKFNTIISVLIISPFFHLDGLTYMSVKIFLRMIWYDMLRFHVHKFFRLVLLNYWGQQKVLRVLTPQDLSNV